MAAWLLRTPDGEIPIEQVCVIGRSSDCEAPIADPNASRRHAALRVVGSDVVVEDLQSRNGTFVEGRLIGSPTTLSTSARIIIGHTVMMLVRAKAKTPAPMRRSVPPGAQLQAADSAHTNTAVPDRAMLDRALAMLAAGRIDECAGGASILVRRQSGLGLRALDEFVHGTSALLVSLAQRTGDPRWLEGLFSMNADCDRMIPAELVDAIEAVAPRGAVRLLPVWVEKLSARSGSLTPAERVILARIERLAH
jgi:hypothetical protein